MREGYPVPPLFNKMSNDAIPSIHKFRHNAEMIDAINKAVMQFQGKVSVAEAVGCLEIVKHKLIFDAHVEYQPNKS